MDKFNEHSKILKIYSIMKRINLEKLFALGIIFLLLTSTFLIFIPKIEAQNRFSGKGSGTPSDPYVITNVKQLQEIKYDLKAHYVLGNDIDASETRYWNNGQGFEPIGDAINPFTGSFDGRGYKIYNLYINTTRDYVGLFGYVGKEGIVKNVGLENVKIISADKNVGGLVGVNSGTVSNCYSTGSVNGHIAVGGLIGVNSGTVSNCYSTGSVNGGNDVGGLIGVNSGTVSNCYSTGSVEGYYYVGGLVGYNYFGKVSNCYSTGSVNGNNDVGGLIGGNYNGTVSNCYSTGSVNGTDYVSGLVGYNEGTVSNCYSTGSVNGIKYVGGLIGVNSGTVSNCYSTGSVNGTYKVGGLVGDNFGKVSNSFWDIQTSGLTTSAGGTGKTTAEMKNVRTYTDVGWSEGLIYPWDFVGNPYDDKGNEDIWDINPNINNGYPYLTTIKRNIIESTVLFVGEIVQHNVKEKQCVIKVNEVFKSFTLAAYEIGDPSAKFVEVRSKEFTWEKEIINKEINVYWDFDALDKIIEKTKPGDVVEVLGLLKKDPNGEIHAEVKLKENLYHFIVAGIFLRAYISKFIIYKDYDPLDKNTAANVYFKINVQGIDDNWNVEVDEKGEYVRIPTLEDFIIWKFKLPTKWEIVVEETDINKELTGPTIAIISEKMPRGSAIQPYPVPIKMHIEVWDEDALWWDKKIAEFELLITKEELQASNYKLSKWIGSKDQGVSLEISFEPLLPRDTTLYENIAKSGLSDLGFNFYDIEALDAIMKLFNGNLPKIEEVKVAIIDEGYPDIHPEWEGAISEVWDCTGDCKLVKPDLASGKGDDHASMIAGIVISKIDGKKAAGLAWNAKLIIIAYKEGNLEKAIRKAVDSGAKVISFSIYSRYEPGIESAIKYALDNGVVLIAAAGNSYSSKPYFPQSFESVIKVAGVTRIDFPGLTIGNLWPFGIFFTQAPYSNYGKYPSFDNNMKMRVDFSAPATIYTTTSLGGGYTLGTGTSSAAPVIASIVAILQGFAKSLHGRYLTINEVYEILRQASIDLGKPGWDPYYGWGLVNVTKALEIIKKGIPTPTINIVKDPTLRSGTVITLSSEGSQLLLHVLDEKGNILFGFDENKGEIISSVIGAEHLILENYSLIYLPINMGNLRIIVDAKYAHMDTERGHIKITTIRNSEVIDEKELEFIIKKNESLNYGVSISENGNILTFTPTPTPSPSPTLPTPTQPPSPTSPTLPVTSPIQSPTKSPSATPLNIELIIIIIVIATTLASLVIVFRKYKAK
jgi:hypothetical protein